MKRKIALTASTLAILSMLNAQSAYGAITERGNNHNAVCQTDTNDDSDSDSGSSGTVTSNGDMHTDIKVEFSENTVPLSRKSVKKLAKATAKAGEKAYGFKIDAGLIYAQWVQEAGADFNANPGLNAHYNLAGSSAGSGVPDWLAKKGVTLGSGHAEGDGIYFYFPDYATFAETYISGYYPSVPKALKAGTKSGKKDADVQAYVHTLKAGGYFTASETAYYNGVASAYATYYGADDVADDLVDSAPSDTNDECDTGDSKQTSSSSDVAENAEKMVGYFVGHYQQTHKASLVSDKSEDADWSVGDIKKDGYTDCSGFVWTVLKTSGCKVPKNMSWNTATMATDAKGKHEYLKEIDKKDAKKGAIVTAGGTGDSGHTVILAEDWHGDDTQVYSMGSDKGVIKRAYKYVMASHPSSSATFCVPSGK